MSMTVSEKVLELNKPGLDGIRARLKCNQYGPYYELDIALLLAVVDLVLRGETLAEKVAWHHSQIPMAYDSRLAAEHAEHEKAWDALT